VSPAGPGDERRHSRRGAGAIADPSSDAGRWRRAFIAAAHDAEALETDAANALTFPLAGLLGEPPGASRTYSVADVAFEPGDDLALAAPVAGSVHVARTNRGVLVDADLTTSLAMECSRCLGPIVVPLELEVDEEALPSIDLHSGLPVDDEEEPDILRLNGHHEVELLPLVRDAISLAEPIAPVCRPDCPGLCVACGQPLETGKHEHPAEIDPRLEALAAFLPDDDESDVPDSDPAAVDGER
jgi:uncharacterized protein